jgi:hypothetical protein
MSRIKVTIVALFAVVALSAVAAGSASAEWFVSGTKLVGTAALATTAKVDTDATLKIIAPGGNVRVLCKGTILSGTKPEIIGGTSEGKAQHLIFEGCETVEPATHCVLSKTTIETEPVKATVAKGTAPVDKITFTPQTKTTFAKVPFSEANTCVFNEPEPVNGAVTVKAPTGQTEEAAQAIEGIGSTENNSLEVAQDKAYIEGGRVLLKLASGSKWSFR